jgi:hypothetical protein
MEPMRIATARSSFFRATARPFTFGDWRHRWRK